MEVDYETLAKVHRLLRQKTDLTDRLARGPRRLAIAQKAEQEFTTAVETAKAKVTETKMAADEKQLQLSGREAKIEDLKKRLNACDSNKEYQLLKDAIAADEQASSVLSDEIFELLERIDTLVQDHKDKTAELEEQKVKTKATTEKVNTEATRLQSELAEIQAELAEAEKLIKGEMGETYRRRAAAHGEDALANTDGKTCGNCQHTFTAQTYSNLLQKKMINCRGCGAMMYMNGKVGLEA